jgi:hypothetical protein
MRTSKGCAALHQCAIEEGQLLRGIAATFLFSCGMADTLRSATRARRLSVCNLVQGVYVIGLEPIYHSYQVRQRPCAHFLHHLAAMNTDSHFTDAELAGDLLAHASARKQGHDFLFAPGQASKSLTDLRPSATLRDARAVAFDPLAHRVE